MKKYLFCQIDILGFSNLICNPPRDLTIDSIEKSYNLIFKKNLKDSKDFNYPIPHYMVFSDTAFIFQELNLENSKKFIIYLSNILQNSFCSIKNEQENLIPQLYFKFPLRGALSIGELIINNNIIGKPIVSTYRWERTQNWIGISLPYKDITLIKESLGYNLFEELVKSNLLVEYDIPTKDGLIKTFAINFITTDNKNKIINIIEKELKNYENDINIYTKYYCTLKFVEFIFNNNLYIKN